MNNSQQANISEKLAKSRDMVNETIRGLLEGRSDMESRLRKAMIYTLEGGGKRVRAAIVQWCCEIASGKVNRNAKIAAAAIEMVHTYSLVHDDLPAMDNDDMRRGRATCHIAFDEATAILAGDGLLTLAFEVLAKEVDDAELAVKLVRELAGAAGASGMIAGQMADLNAENVQAEKEMLEYIHLNKTAKMFGAAAVMGTLCGGANGEKLEAMSKFGLKLGLGFQVADDILDVTGSSEEIGKTAGKDEKAGKMTYPALMGLQEAKKLEKRLADEAIGCLKVFGKEADVLRELTKGLVARTK